MEEDENIQEFHMNILDIANAFDSLGEKMPKEKLARKILRSLPKRFDMKVTTIEEAQDISSMKVQELIGSLQNFEIMINNRVEKNEKNIAFVSNTNTEETQGNLENDENLDESIVLLGRLFNKILKQTNWRPRSDGKNIKYNISEKQNNEKSFSTNDKGNQSKVVQCYECEGYDHIRTECATFLKKQKKSLTVAWSDEDILERISESESTKRVTVLTGRFLSDTESCDEELVYDELATSYKNLYVRSAEICKMLGEQKKINNQLLTERSNHLAKISELNDEVTLLNLQLEQVKK